MNGACERIVGSNLLNGSGHVQHYLNLVLFCVE